MKLSLHLLLSLFLWAALFGSEPEKPRVFVFTDINIDQGDPDDRQSLIHLFWNSDELDIEGIVPDRLDAGGFEACQLALEAYEKDFERHDWREMGFLHPTLVEERISDGMDTTLKLFETATSEKDRPLWVLVWGDMTQFGHVLREYPQVSKLLRVITIGTGVMLERNIAHVPENWEKFPPGRMMNWNAAGRNQIFQDERFHHLWWIEMNWTYEGMFYGSHPEQMFQKLIQYGALGNHMKEVVRNQAWAQYFRVGDTPSVLYLLDPSHDRNDPEELSWAGKFEQPFPEKRPHYYTDFSGDLNWNYADPTKTWNLHEEVLELAKSTLLEKRAEMYAETIEKLNRIYSISL